MNPLGLVKHFHKLSRAIGFDLFGCLDLEIVNFEVRSSTDFTERFKFEKFTILGNAEKSDGWGPLVSNSAENVCALEMFKSLTCGVHLPVALLNETVRDR